MDAEKRTDLGYELTDYGKLIFEYNSLEKKDPLYVSSEKLKANLKSPWFYYLMSIPIVMITWFIASLISAAGLRGDARLLRIGLTLGSLIPMAICCFIVICIAFGFWGNLYQWRFGGAYNKKEEFIRIYKDYVVVKKHDVTSVYETSRIVGVELHWCYYIRLIFPYSSQTFFLEIPPNSTAAERLQRTFGDKLIIAQSQRSREPVCFDSLQEFITGMVFALIAIGVGIGLICMRVYLNVNVPVFLGMMFIGGGLMVTCGIFSFIPFVKDIVTPFMAATFFIVIPWGLVSTLHKVWQLGEGFKSFTVFSPFSCVAVVLSSVSVLFIASGVRAIIDYIRYGHKLGKA